VPEALIVILGRSSNQKRKLFKEKSEARTMGFRHVATRLVPLRPTQDGAMALISGVPEAGKRGRNQHVEKRNDCEREKRALQHLGGERAEDVADICDLLLGSCHICKTLSIIGARCY